MMIMMLMKMIDVDDYKHGDVTDMEARGFAFP